MTLFYLIAQIQTGVSWLDPLLDRILTDYGAITVLIVVVLAFVMITLYNTNQRANENERFVLKVAQKNQDTNDDLIKTKDEFSAFKIESAKKEGVFEGQIVEMSKTIKHQQDKQEQNERIWNEERRQLKEEIDKLSRQINHFQEELNGKTELIKAMELERETLNGQLKTRDGTLAQVEREKLQLMTQIRNLEGEIESLKRLRDEQAQQITATGKELMDMKQELQRLEESMKAPEMLVVPDVTLSKVTSLSIPPDAPQTFATTVTPQAKENPDETQ
jgi:chromosome segregation ATPase